MTCDNSSFADRDFGFDNHRNRPDLDFLQYCANNFKISEAVTFGIHKSDEDEGKHTKLGN